MTLAKSPYFHINTHIPLSPPLLLQYALQLPTAAGHSFLSLLFYPLSHPLSISHSLSLSVSLSLSSAMIPAFPATVCFISKSKAPLTGKFTEVIFKPSEEARKRKQTQNRSRLSALVVFLCLSYFFFSLSHPPGLLRHPALITCAVNKVDV